MTRRGRGEGTVWQLPSGRWSAQVTNTNWMPGQPRRITRNGATQAEALRKARQVLRDLDDGRPVFAKSPTLAQHGERWLTRRRGEVESNKLAQATLDNNEWAWRLYIEPTLGNHRLDALNVEVLAAWMLERERECNQRGRPHSASSKRLMYSTLRSILNDAVGQDLLRKNFLLMVKAPSPTRVRAKPLSLAESRQFFEVAASDHLFALWVLLAGLGLRIGEALALTWADLDVDQRTVVIGKTVGRRMVGTHPVTGKPVTALQVRHETKTHQDGTSLRLPKVVLGALLQQRRRQAAARLLAKDWSDNDLIFATSVGTHLEARNVLRLFKALALAAGISRNVRTHDLRHTAASHLIAEGVQIVAIKELLRHTRIGTTVNVYSHLLDEVRNEAADAMDNRMHKILPT